MSDSTGLLDAISERDASRVRSLISEADFFVISVSDDDDENDEVAAMTAEIGEFEAVVAFTSEKAATVFVTEREDLFGDEEGIDGVLVEGTMLLEYLPEGFGLLLDPESETASVIDPSLASEVTGQ